MLGIAYATSSLAQTQGVQGRVEYKVQKLENERTKALDKMLGAAAGTGQALGETVVLLDFDAHQAITYLAQNTTLTKLELNRVQLDVGVSEQVKWWQDSLGSYYLMEGMPPLLKDRYLMVENFEEGETHTGWAITEETKEIGGYTCFKATRTNVREGPASGGKICIPDHRLVQPGDTRTLRAT